MKPVLDKIVHIEGLMRRKERKTEEREIVPPHLSELD
jgi:hypothetical protein